MKSKFFDALFDKVVTKYTRPAIEKIPVEILKMIKDIHGDKILDVLGVAIATILPGPLGDLSNELTSELLMRIDKEVGGGGKTSDIPTGKEGAGIKTIFNILLNPELEQRATENLKAIARLVEGKERKEKARVMSLLDQLGQRGSIIFLNRDANYQKEFLDTFLEKAKDAASMEESIKKLKKELSKAKAIFNKEILGPIAKKVEPNSTAYKNAEDFAKNAKSFRQRMEEFNKRQHA